MQERKNANYFFMDILRCIVSGKIFISVVGIFLVMNLSIANISDALPSVLSRLVLGVQTVPFLIVLPFCAFTYADCFCEDIECKFIQLQLIRGNIKKYVISKVIIIFISAILVLILGIFLFVTIQDVKLPYIGIEDNLGESLLEVSVFVRNGHYLLFCMFYAFKFGMLAGVLSLLGAYISLYIPNRLLILSIPFMAYYFILYYNEILFQDLYYFDPSIIFSIGDFQFWQSEWQNYFTTILMSLSFGLLLSIAIYRRIKRRLDGE